MSTKPQVPQQTSDSSHEAETVYRAVIKLEKWMSEELNFEWPAFSDVLDDVAAGKSFDRRSVSRSYLRNTNDHSDLTLEELVDLKKVETTPPPPIKIVDDVNIPAPLKPLELDTSRVRELLESRPMADSLDQSLLDQPPKEAEAEREASEDLALEQSVENANGEDAEPLDDSDELEFAEAELANDTETEFDIDIETDNEVEADATEPLDDTHLDAEDELDDTQGELDNLDGHLIEETEQTPALDQPVETEVLDPETDLDTETDLLDGTETSSHDVEIDWDFAPDHNTDLSLEWPTEATDDIDLGIEWAIETDLAAADEPTSLDSWEEGAASTAQDLDESALVFDMSDEDIIQHEQNAGADPGEDIFISEAETTLDAEPTFGATDDPFAESADLSEIDLGEDNRVVNLFEQRPNWDNDAFDSVEVAAEIENDLFDLDYSAENVVPIDGRGAAPNAGLTDDGEETAEYQFHGLDSDLESSSTSWSDFGDSEVEGQSRSSWRTLDEDTTIEPPVDRPESDPWAYMRPKEETASGGWWANRPRFLGGRKKSAKADADAEIEELEVPGLAYDNNCPNCGETGEVRNDDPIAREVHLECLECANQWHTHYAIDAEAS